VVDATVPPTGEVGTLTLQPVIDADDPGDRHYGAPTDDAPAPPVVDANEPGDRPAI
jgi:hypothetical protein